MCEQRQTTRSYLGPGTTLAPTCRLCHSQRQVTLVCDQPSYQAIIWPTGPIRMPPILGRRCAESGIHPTGLVYTPPPSLSHLTQMRVCRHTRTIGKLQRLACKMITGTFKSSPSNMMELLANIPPVQLRLADTCYREALWLCSLPSSHPLHSHVLRAARHPPRFH